MEAALSTAKAMIVLMKSRRRRHAIILQDGEPKIRALSDADQVRESWTKAPTKLVGVYSNGVTAEEVADDIIATDQGEYFTRRRSNP